MPQSADTQLQSMVDALIDSALDGAAPWQRPWQTVNVLPVNAFTGRPYSGANLLWLWSLGSSSGDARWATKRQAEAAGYSIREGAQGATITIMSTYTPKRERDAAKRENREPRRARYMTSSVVYCADDIVGLPAQTAASNLNPVDVPELLERLIADSGANVRHRGNNAFHVPNTDTIVLPGREQFASSAGYTSTVLHELAHWTGGADRLNRIQDTSFGSTLYAREELVAEIAAAMTAAQLGIASQPDNSAAYLRSWTRRTDPAARRKLLVKASRMATAAAAMLVALATEHSRVGV